MPRGLQIPAPTTPSLGVSTETLQKDVRRNAVAHLVGRNVISVGRLLVARTIAIAYGREILGGYSVVIALLSIAEWLLDFGTSDVFVRELCKTPGNGTRLMRMMTGLKLIQMAIVSVGFALLIPVLGYPSDIVQAGRIAAVSLLFFGGVLVYHTIFKATLTMEKEIFAELLSVIVMLAMVRLGSSYATLPVILICHTLSRATFFGLCWLLGRTRFHPSLSGVTWPDVRWSFKTSAVIGTIGLVAVAYEAIDVLVLSRVSTLDNVALYYGAQRFVAPVVVALAAIGGTLYPVAASYWPASRADFQRCCQRAADIVFVLAGLAICTIVAGSDFLMGLFRLAPGAPALRILVIVIFFKAISSTLGPILFVVKAERSVMGMVAAALACKTVLIWVLAPRYGYIAAAVAAVVVDSATSTATLYFLRRATGFSLRFAIPLKASVIALFAAYAPSLIFPTHGVLAAMAAGALFVVLAFLSRAVTLAEVRQLSAWKTT